jgi:hypothetical protein
VWIIWWWLVVVVVLHTVAVALVDSVLVQDCL